MQAKYSKREAKCADFLQNYLTARNWWVRKMHGNLYQMGIMDLLTARAKDGQIILIELKTEKKNLYEMSLEQLLKKLKGSQIGNIRLLAKIHAPVWVICGVIPDNEKIPLRWFIVNCSYKNPRFLKALSTEEMYERINA